jgi:ribose transport system ATP-binding protein
MTARAVLSLKGVSKTFPGVVALDGVSLDVFEGEVHALLGENGAGKSTLMAIAAGAMAANSGTVEIGGIPLDAALPSRAQELGIGVVYQHTSVLNELTVAENLLYCVPKERRTTTISTNQWIGEQLALVGAVFDRRTRVGELNVAERQLVEIGKALALQPKVLVLDEPTEALTAKETEQLFVNIERITALGTAVVYISHRLPEVKRVADHITVLRDGKVRGTFSADGISENEILGLIIGRPVDHAFPEKAERRSGSAPLLVARKITNGVLQGIDLEIVPGEVVGLAGVEGNGQRDFMRSLAGLVPVTGEIAIDGKPTALGDPIGVQSAGIVYLPGDRHSEGLFMSLSVRENIAALVLNALSRLGFVSRRREGALVASQISALAIKTPSPESRIASLSGGNQQKVLFARSLSRKPVVLLADEPTRGVDAGARIELYSILRKTAAHGAAVVVLSSDAIELQGLCDRVLVFSRGQIVKTLTGDQITEENITGAAINADMRREGAGSDHNARREGLRRFISGDYAPFLILLTLIVLLGVYTASISEFFLTTRSINGTLFLVSALAFVSMGQLIVLLTGGIDLSVGPLTGLTVVILSFFAGDDQGLGELFLGLGIAAAAAMAVGFANGVLVRGIGLTPVIATLTSYIALQGLALLLRSTPAGYFRSEVVDVLAARAGPFPIAFLVVVAVALGAEWVLRRTRFGMELRAIGSNEVAAHRLGARVNRSVILAYVLCSLFTAVGGLLLAAQVGIGDPAVGVNYSLQSISAVVLGGASIFGGRGSFLGALAGAVLIQEITAATGFLDLGTAWQYWLPGLLILVAAGMYSRTRVSAAARHI